MNKSLGKNSILIVDDDEYVLDCIELMFKTAGCDNIVKCSDPRQVKSILEKGDIACMILDIMMPHKSGNEVLSETNLDHPEIPVVILTSTTDVGSVVHFMKEGAVDYLTKPVEKEKLVATVSNIVRLKYLEQENELLKEKLLDSHDPDYSFFSSIITRDPKIKAIFRYIESVAHSAHPCLITGETGTGKDLFARAIHDVSGRDGKFVAVNVAGLDDTVFTDTLFGHKKGAYTSADASRSGLIKDASLGTIFLDEIGDLSSQSQMKLLRLLQSGEYYPLGSDVCVRSDARVVAATNKNLDKAIVSGEFRRDLYYRLYTHRIDLPPLRDRLDDIPLLLNNFLEKASELNKKEVKKYSDDLITLLMGYDFPGNIRELESMVYDVVSWNSGSMLTSDLFLQRFIPGSFAPVNNKVDDFNFFDSGKFPTMREAEYFLIKKALEVSNNNQVKAASLLGITRQTLSSRLKDK